MSFESPVLLVLLLVVPAAFGAHFWLERRRDERAAGWASPSLIPNMAPRPPAWRRHVPVSLLLIGLALLLVGFARPATRLSVKQREATVVLVVDVSGSMAANDSQPDRLAAARRVAERFVDQLPSGYRVSVVAFSDHAAVVAPPTTDLVRVRGVLAQLKSGPQGTALAEAVYHAVSVTQSAPRAANGKRAPSVVVVLSDGGQTAGTITQKQAIAKAHSVAVPVSAVAIGTPNGIVQQKLKGGLTERIQVPVEPALLKSFAQSTGGRFFAGVRAVDVASIYRELGSRVGYHKKKVEVTAAAAGGGIVFMLAGVLLSGAWFRRFA